jgi:hypothetical protein
MTRITTVRFIKNRAPVRLLTKGKSKAILGQGLFLKHEGEKTEKSHTLGEIRLTPAQPLR